MKTGIFQEILVKLPIIKFSASVLLHVVRQAWEANRNSFENCSCKCD